MGRDKPAKRSNAKPISLKPLSFETALKGLLAVDPKAINSPKKAAAKKKAKARKKPAKKGR